MNRFLVGLTTTLSFVLMNTLITGLSQTSQAQVPTPATTAQPTRSQPPANSSLTSDSPPSLASPWQNGPIQPVVQPNFLKIEGIRTASAPQQRTLTIRSLQPLTNLQVRTFDLYNETETRVFPKRLITVGAIAGASNPNAAIETDAQFISIPLTFDTQAATSGAFSGELILDYRGGELAVPITVTIKDPASPWPLMFIAFGVILGTSVSGYSNGGRVNDEITVSIERLRTWMKDDRALPIPFASQIESHLVDAEQKRHSQQFESAQADLQLANDLWFKWRRERQQWVDAIDLARELEDRTKEYVKQDVKYINSLRQALFKARRQANEFTSPEALSDHIASLNQQFQIFDETFDKLRAIEAIYQEQINRNDSLKAFLQGIDSQLKNILPTDAGITDELQGIQAKLDKLLNRPTSVTPAVSPHHEVSATPTLESTEKPQLPSTRALAGLTLDPDQPTVTAQEAKYF
jgi:hypothetical protein